MKRITIICLLSAVFIIYSISYLVSRGILPYELNNPITCSITGGNWGRVGFGGRYCKYIYSDAKKTCFSNKDCQSRKCVLCMASDREDCDPKIEKLNDKQEYPIKYSVRNGVVGRCSVDSMGTCFSGEMLIEDDRVAFPPPVCD